jgi:hypothetical protein
MTARDPDSTNENGERFAFDLTHEFDVSNLGYSRGCLPKHRPYEQMAYNAQIRA